MNKIALIGNGYWGSKIKKYIPEFFDLKYVADSKFDKNIIWNDSDVIGVIIATSIETHYEIAREALVHDKHVFCEKPVTLYGSQAKELEDVARNNNLYIGIDYVQTFSPSIAEILKHIDEIGVIEYVEMSTKHLGRFMDYNVYWLLASHHLSILDMFIDLKELTFTFQDCLYYKELCTTGSIMFDYGKIDVSLNFPGKEMYANFYGSKGTIKYNPLSEKSIRVTLYNKGYKKLPPELITYDRYYHFDESNNLRYAMEYFRDLIEGKAKSNIDRAVKITRILENR